MNFHKEADTDYALFHGPW